MHDHANRLFSQASLDETLLRRVRLSGEAAINEMDRDQFLSANDEELVRHVVSRFEIEPLVLHEEHAMMDFGETHVDVSQDPRRFAFGDRPSRYMVPGTQLTVTIPFIGTYEIWRLKPNPWQSSFPTGDVVPAKGSEPGHLVVTISHAHDVPRERFVHDYQQLLKLIRQFIQHGQAQVRSFNEHLPTHVRTAITNRRTRIKQHEGLSELLNIPLRERPGAPSITPIRLPPRIVSPLPPPPRSGFKPEPGITSDLFEKILAIIRHEGRTFETTPKTYAKHDEEELRDIVLAHLNGHFQGAATGEAFRKSGKTDIRIEDASRAAFVAECKVWEGAKKFDAAINQLVGYLTWRDAKAAIIVFNKGTKNFTELLSKVPDRLRAHANFVSEEAISEPGEWRVLVKSAEDEGRRITLHTFLFDLYVKPR